MVFRANYASFFGAGAVTALGCALRKATTRAANVAHCDAKTEESLLDVGEGSNPHPIREAHANSIEHDLHFAASKIASASKSKAKTKNPWDKDERPGIGHKYKSFELIELIDVAPGTKLFRFALPSKTDTFFLPPCSTLQVRLGLSKSPSDQLERYYTPTTPNGATGFFDLIVKNCRGRMTTPLFKLKVGDSLDFRAVMFKLKYKPNRWDHIGMIAGGSGISPMMQIIRQALPLGVEDPYYTVVPPAKDITQVNNDLIDPEKTGDKTKLSLLFMNRTERHIILKKYFDALEEKHPDRFTVDYAVDKFENPAKWDRARKPFVGYLTKEMVTKTMPPPDPKKKKNVVVVCGPDPLLNTAFGTLPTGLDCMHRGLATQPMGSDFANLAPVAGILGDLGYSHDDTYRF